MKLLNRIENEAEKISNELIKEIEFPKKKIKPIVLLFGGFQGSGKTTIVDLLKDDLGLVVISPDEIRYKMFEKGYKLDDEFRQIVRLTSVKALKIVYQLGYSIVVDENMIPSRIDEIKQYFRNENNKHRLITVCLQTSKEELIRRLNSREPIPGRYQGKAYELEGSIEKYGELDQGKYDLVINTEKFNPNEIAEIVKDYV